MENAFWNNIFKKSDESESQQLLALKKVPIFQGLSDREFNSILKIVHHRTFDKEEFIFKSNTPGLGMYIISHGQVKLDGKDTDGKGMKFATLNPGDFFGEISLISEENRIFNALAISNCELIAFFRTDLLEIITRSPKLGNKILLNLATVLGNRLINTNEFLINGVK